MTASTAERLEAARHLIAEAAAHDGASAVSDQALLAVAQGQRELISFDAQGNTDAHEQLAAVGIWGEGEIDLVVAPSERGRGLGSRGLAALLEQVDADARRGAPTAGDTADAVSVRAWSHGENPAAEALLSRSGFAPIRTLYRMALDPALLPRDGRDPLAFDTPAGLSLRAFDPAVPADATAWVRANAAAFASHPEQGRITEEDFALMRQEPWFRADDLILLGGDDPAEIVGSTWIKTLRHDDEGDESTAGTTVECELYAVGVRPEYAGQGLGRLLLDVTLARMAQHEPQRVTLYVDGDNTAASGLYERAGFVIEQRSTQWGR